MSFSLSIVDASQSIVHVVSLDDVNNSLSLESENVACNTNSYFKRIGKTRFQVLKERQQFGLQRMQAAQVEYNLAKEAGFILAEKDKKRLDNAIYRGKVSYYGAMSESQLNSLSEEERMIAKRFQAVRQVRNTHSREYARVKRNKNSLSSLNSNSDDELDEWAEQQACSMEMKKKQKLFEFPVNFDDSSVHLKS